MNKREEVAYLKKSLLFGNVDASYIRDLNESKSQYTIILTLVKLYERITSGFVSHQEYFIAVRGLLWTLETGRCALASHTLWLRGMKVDEVMALVRELRRAGCKDFEAVAWYLNHEIALEQPDPLRTHFVRVWSVEKY